MEATELLHRMIRAKEDERDNLMARVSQIETLLEALRAELPASGAVQTPQHVSMPAEASQHHAANDYPKVDIEGLNRPDAAIRILTEAGKPMTTGEIVEALEANGAKYTNQETKFNNTYTAMDRRKDVLKRIGRGVWALKAWGENKGESDLFSK